MVITAALVFMFYRIFSAIALEEPLSYAACALSAGIAAFASSWALGHALRSGRIAPNDRKLDQLKGSAPLFGAAALVVLSLGLLVAFGFSDRFAERVLHWRSYDGFLEQEAFWAGVMYVIPVISIWLSAPALLANHKSD